MSPGEVTGVGLTVAALVPWTTLMISTDITETVIIPLEVAEEGELRIKWLISPLNECNHTFVWGWLLIFLLQF